MSLLEKAKKIKHRNKGWTPIGEDQINLARAWVRNEVSLKQVSEALKIGKPTAYVILARSLKQYLIQR